MNTAANPGRNVSQKSMLIPQYRVKSYLCVYKCLLVPNVNVTAKLIAPASKTALSSTRNLCTFKEIQPLTQCSQILTQFT